MIGHNSDHAHGDSWPQVAPEDFWEDRYASAGRIWSGRVNDVLADLAPQLVPGSSLDLGCGEGADAIWLAQHGWAATGVDISSTAVRRASEAAAAAGVPPDRIRFVAANLATVDDAARYDLVTASFLHSPVELPRTDVLRRAAALVASGGHLLITSHAAAPPWADPNAHTHRFPTPAEEIRDLDLAPGQWETLVAEVRHREATGPDGQPATLDDVVVLLRRGERTNH